METFEYLLEKSCTNTSFPSISVNVCMHIAQPSRKQMASACPAFRICSAIFPISIYVFDYIYVHNHQEDRWHQRVQHFEFVLPTFQCQYLKASMCMAIRKTYGNGLLTWSLSLNFPMSIFENIYAHSHQENILRWHFDFKLSFHLSNVNNRNDSCTPPSRKHMAMAFSVVLWIFKC